MGMAASSLRFAQLTARKNQVEFEGQQINQQRLVLSQKSSAIYNDMLTKQVPTAPDPSQFTKIVYKFNNGNGTSQILNLAKKASGPYNYNITYKRPAMSTVKAQSKFQNVNFVKNVDGKGYTANINGIARNLTAVGDSTKKQEYEQKLAIYNQLKAIDDTRKAISTSDKDKFSSNAFKEYAQSAGLSSSLFERTGTGADTKYTIDKNNTLAVALFAAAGVKSQNGKTIGQAGFDYSAIELLDSDKATAIQQNVQALIGVLVGGTLADANGKPTEISDTDTEAVFKAIANKLGGKDTAAAYKKEILDPAFTAYQASCSTPGIMNIGEGQALYSYEDDNGETCYMYVPMENVEEGVNSSYADEVTVYENATTFLEDQTETEQQDANVVLSDDGQISKITFADGTVVTPEVVTEMDQDAYDAAMVEYEYKKSVYEKEMNDANAKVKIIQAQDQKLEVRLKQLDTEQKALSTEIDAVKSVRDKSIEGSFKTFG